MSEEKAESLSSNDAKRPKKKYVYLDNFRKYISSQEERLDNVHNRITHIGESFHKEAEYTKNRFDTTFRYITGIGIVVAVLMLCILYMLLKN